MLQQHDEIYAQQCFYFDKFSFPAADVDLYQSLIPWRRKSLMILEAIGTNDLDEARKLIRLYKMFLFKMHLPPSYFLFRSAIRHALLKHRFGRLILVAKKVFKR